MPRLDQLRPDLSALLKQDLKSGPRLPLDSPDEPAPLTADGSEALAGEIAARHAAAMPPVRVQELATPDAEEPEVLLTKPKPARGRASY